MGGAPSASRRPCAAAGVPGSSAGRGIRWRGGRGALRDPDVRDRWGAGDGEGGGKEAGEAEEETKKTLGELGMAASGPAGPPPLRATSARAPTPAVAPPDLGFREAGGWGGAWA